MNCSIQLTKRVSAAPKPSEGGSPVRNSVSHSLPRRSLSEGGSLPSLFFCSPSHGLRFRRRLEQRTGASQAATPLRALARSTTSQPAPTTRPTVTPLSITTQPAAATRPMVLTQLIKHRAAQHRQRCAALYAHSRRQEHHLRSSTTQPAAKHRQRCGALQCSLYSNTTGDDNTANGFQALFHNTAGRRHNTANGAAGALHDNMTGEPRPTRLNGYQAPRT